ncbi:MAG TPA: hypothetical protein PK142_03230 [bacterium]|nr:hypothetical protein [bacterium]
MKTLKWVVRIMSLALLIFALPFYFGYGNPLPFINPNYSLWENVSLTMLPLIFIGLALGWRYEKLAGFLIIISTLIIFILGILTDSSLSANLLVPLIPGILYLIVGYKK